MTKKLPVDQTQRKAPSHAWFEEYEVCSCSYMARTKAELPGYCERHGTNRRRKPIKLPNVEDGDLGYAG